MAKFAQYFLKFENNDLLSPLQWNQREEIFAGFLEKEESISFTNRPSSDKKDREPEQPDKMTIYRHRLYHLESQPKIVIMRLANVKLLPIEKDFTTECVEHFPSVFVIFDIRDRCRRVAIQKLQSSFSSTDQVAKILLKSLNRAMLNECNIGFKLLAQRYTMDFYKLWREKEQQTVRLRFSITPNEITRNRDERENMSQQKYPDADVGIIHHIMKLNEESERYGYKTSIELEPDNGPVMYADESSDYVRNLARISASTGTPIQLFTNDGGCFECFIDKDIESDDKIVTSCIEDTSCMESLFHNEISKEVRERMEEKVVEFVNGMKMVVDEREEVI